jgi:hypothetical protein
MTKNEIAILQAAEKNQLAVLQTSPQQYLQALRPKSVDDVFASSEPALGMIAKELGENQARAVVVILISEIVDFFNSSNTMNGSQVATTTDLIIEEYPYFKIDDLKLCFRNAMKGRYGEIYNRLDGSVIMNWLKQYNQERCAKADIASYNEYKEHIGEENTGLFYDDYRNQLKELASQGNTDAQEALRRSNEVLHFMKKRSLEKQKKQLEEYERKLAGKRV